MLSASRLRCSVQMAPHCPPCATRTFHRSLHPSVLSISRLTNPTSSPPVARQRISTKHPRPFDTTHRTPPLRNIASTSCPTIRTHDTIFALATGSGRAGVAIIRISGPSTSHLYHLLCRTSLTLQPYRNVPPSHKLVLRNIHHPSTHEVLDSGAGVIHFPPNASYTGEESLELHIHGGIATITDILSALASIGHTRAGRVRIAEPGEFTRRAFENGRMDLSAVEGLHALIDAETTVQRRVALHGANGLQSKRYDEIRSELLTAMAMVEALIDFSDEDGVEEGTWSAAVRGVDSVAVMLRSELGIGSNDGWEQGGGMVRHVGEILSGGVRLAIYGPPNAGKSSLLNRMADRNAAIVSDIPGTTRDVLQLHLDLAGYKVIVYDTAGIRDATDAGKRSIDEIEQIGIERATQVVRSADLSLLVLPAHNAPNNVQILRPDSYSDSDPDLVFYNKLDLVPTPTPPTIHPSNDATKSWKGSVKTGDGIPALLDALAQLISTKYALAQTEAPLITQSRHRFHLHESLRHIDTFHQLASESQPDVVLAAEELRYAAKAVGKLTGRDVSPDEILGSIFSTFCIGK